MSANVERFLKIENYNFSDFFSGENLPILVEREKTAHNPGNRKADRAMEKVESFP